MNGEQSFQIWSEGYSATGQSSGAINFGSESGKTFQEACDKFFAKDPRHRGYYNSESLTYWACKLYDNESDARRSFG
jgi:hypothetical protein